ncbi:MAG: hypothetical protein ACRDHX_08965 [Chloroflexota bacterium]
MSAEDEVAALAQLYAQAWDEGIFLVEWGWGMAAAGRREILQRLEEQTGRTIDHTVYQAFSLGDCFELGMAPGSGASRLDACHNAIQALKGPADSNPADGNPADGNPADSNPADSNPADGNLAAGNPAAADKLAAGDARTVAVGSPPQPLADWDSEQAGSRINPLLVWWSRLDGRYQLEVQRTGSGAAVLSTPAAPR